MSRSGEDFEVAASEDDLVSLTELDVSRGTGDGGDGRETGGEGGLQLPAARDVVSVHMCVQTVLEREIQLRDQCRVSSEGMERNEKMKK